MDNKDILEKPDICVKATMSIQCIRSCMRQSAQCNVVVMIASDNGLYQCCHYGHRLEELTVSEKKGNQIWQYNQLI